MASSRLEKIGTIFSRVNGLLKSGAMKWEDRPIWYDIYKRMPPIDEPRFDRPAANMDLKSIFYKEDVIRAKYHKEVKPGTYNLFNNEYKSKTRRFIEEYNKLEAIENVSKEELFEMAVNAIDKEAEARKSNEDEKVEKDSIVKKFKEASEEQRKKINLVNIMKEE